MTDTLCEYSIFYSIPYIPPPRNSQNKQKYMKTDDSLHERAKIKTRTIDIPRQKLYNTDKNDRN